MSKKLIYDFSCNKCGYDFEKLVDSDQRVAPCPECGATGYRLIPAPTIDWKMGVNPDSKGSRKWERMHEQAAKREAKRNGTDEL